MSGEALRQEIRKTAEERVKQVMADAQAKADQITAEASAEATRILDTKAREAARDLGQVERAEAAKARMECVGRILKVYAQHVDEAFREAEPVVARLPADNPALYKSVLTNFVAEAMEGLGNGRLAAIARDADREIVDGILKSLSASRRTVGGASQCSVSAERLNASGGVVLRTEDKRAYFVNTFESKFLRARDELRAKVEAALAGRG
jgi:vacuolar-type H+-ATPase subunit E/Vma4